MVVFSAFLFIGISSFNAVIHLREKASFAAAVLLFAVAALCFALLLSVRKSGRYRLLFHLYSSILVALVSTLGYMEGGFQAGTYMWTLAIITMGPHLLGIKGTAFWAVIVALVYVFFYFFNASSFAPQPTLTLSPAVLQRFDFVVLSSLLFIMFLWSIGFEGLLARSMKEKRLAEEKLRQAQRLESVGLLAGGIAHDFNNLLSVILTYTNLLYDGLDATDPRREEALQIRFAGERAADIVRQLLQFSRKEMDQPEPLDLNDILFDIKGLLERSLGETVSLFLSLKEGLWKVLIDRRQIQQVLLNLTVNARDAMPEGGRLDIQTGNQEIERKEAKKLGIKPGQYVQLLVRDGGIGMNDEIKSRIFEPFFTTKSLGKGTGLGLSTTYGIIKQAHGTVSVDSSPGRGTVFYVLLPVYEGQIATIKQTEKETVEKRDKKYKILLVEDDDGVREATRRILTRAGFQMLSVRDSDEALRICRSHVGQIDVLLTDVVMPGMPGSRLAELVPIYQPGIAVVLMSGYADDEIVRYGLAQGRFTFVQKPFNQNELINAIHQSVSRSERMITTSTNRITANTIQC
ncbi:MAG: response regulator [Deltaproteobacteria bacterium]|nr:response regulator [Deltaproteobacteria bacterium]